MQFYTNSLNKQVYFQKQPNNIFSANLPNLSKKNLLEIIKNPTKFCPRNIQEILSNVREFMQGLLGKSGNLKI